MLRHEVQTLHAHQGQHDGLARDPFADIHLENAFNLSVSERLELSAASLSLMIRNDLIQLLNRIIQRIQGELNKKCQRFIPASCESVCHLHA